jgi:mannosyl-oligosaccharide alpha-1,2-mannosidase
MLRYRRYRVFLLFAAITLFIFWRFSTPTRWEQSAHAVDTFKQQIGLREGKSTQDRQQQEPLRPKPKPENGPPKYEPEKVPPPPVETIAKPKQSLPPPKPTAKPSATPPVPEPKPVTAPSGELIREDDEDGDLVRLVPGGPSGELVEQIIAEAGQGRKEEDLLPSDARPIRWEKQEEHFPVESTIQLPTGTPKPMPRIQAKFDTESATEKAARKEKLEVIKEAFVHAWDGYKQFAWAKDELMPVTGGFKDPFNGWGATLIDSLDTMWMMGLKNEFEEALEFVEKVDFKTSRRADIPLFETVIRFLGGLIGAYDVSEGKYRILLDKAVELAEVLIGAFDTPNRMPMTFYQWKPAFASQPHRAPNRVVLAEMGSMAVEFTRLSQITKEPKYYDAIARITDALQEWQNHTRVPGLWPIYIDASGCERVQYSASVNQFDPNSTLTSVKKGKEAGQVMVPLEKPPPMVFSSSKGPADEADAKSSIPQPAANAMPGGLGGDPFPEKPSPQEGSSSKGRIQGWDENHPEKKATVPSKKDGLVDSDEERSSSNKQKRQLGYPETDWEKEETPTVPTVPEPAKAYVNRVKQTPKPAPECRPHGLGSYSNFGTEEFTMGSMADSTYEYFPKVCCI